MTEVLVALLIMSIGLVSLTTMFPLSVLRSIKASQLTHAADLRYNAESLLKMRPNLLNRALFDSDDYQDTLANANVTQPNYNGFVIDPVGYHRIGGNPPLFGDPSYITNNPTIPIRHHAGTDTNLIPGDLAPAVNAAQLTAAQYMATLPDSWVTTFDYNLLTTNVSNATTQTVPGLTASGFTMPTSGSARIVFFSRDGRTTQTRTIISVDAADLVTWGDDRNSNNALDAGEETPLPFNFNAKSLRIEAQEARYSWLLTVREAAHTVAGIDVVVFFRRNYSVDADDSAGNLLYGLKNGFQFTKGLRTITVVLGASQPRPFIKPGNFVFDADNLLWYQIRGFSELVPNEFTVLLDRQASASSPINPNTNAQNGKVMFPRGVVEVFTIH